MRLTTLPILLTFWELRVVLADIFHWVFVFRWDARGSLFISLTISHSMNGFEAMFLVFNVLLNATLLVFVCRLRYSICNSDAFSEF